MIKTKYLQYPAIQKLEDEWSFKCIKDAHILRVTRDLLYWWFQACCPNLCASTDTKGTYVFRHSSISLSVLHPSIAFLSPSVPVPRVERISAPGQILHRLRRHGDRGKIFFNTFRQDEHSVRYLSTAYRKCVWSPWFLWSYLDTCCGSEPWSRCTNAFAETRSEKPIKNCNRRVC